MRDKRIIVVERGAVLDRLWWRWTCTCGQQGEWLPSLNDAERYGAAHNRIAHEMRVSA